MNYELMSDFEINKAAAIASGMDVSGATEGNNKMYGYVKDYCNNPSDAWSIIIENKIGIQHFNRGSWQAYCQGDEVAHDENPLRAAMIVFLMMNEK